MAALGFLVGLLLGAAVGVSLLLWALDTRRTYLRLSRDGHWHSDARQRGY